MLGKINSFLTQVNDVVWGIPLIVLIIATGILLTVRVKGLQFRKLILAFKYIFQKEENGTGEVSSFGALCTALSATIGTGNIVGVATAIAAGGPGALFWMWLAALVGTATKYAECMLSVKYRQVSEDGHILGGPFYYIEKGMGKKFKWLAVLFAIFGVCAGIMGIGTFTQVNSITGAVEGFFKQYVPDTVMLFGREYSLVVVVAGAILTVGAALVIIGGIKRIAKVAEVIVPFMAIVYVIVTVTIIICNIGAVPTAVKEIVSSAFSLKPVAGGLMGTSIMLAMRNGVARGIFSNEAGLGSAPIAASTATTQESVRQGLISMTGTFIDTIIICTLTGLSIVISGAWKVEGLEGIQITTKAFTDGLPFAGNVSSFILMICLIFFAFTTILGWSYYSERCLEYLVGDRKKAVITYRWVYILAVLIGPYMTVKAVFTIADIFNGLMALPNLIALIALSGVVAAETKIYLNKLKKK